MKTRPALTVGNYHEHPVVPALAQAFVRRWRHDMPAVSAPPLTITPDASIDLQWIDGRFRVAGPDKSAMIELVPPGGTVIGFSFRPAMASDWLGVPAVELLDQRLDLEELWGARARRLADRVAEEAPKAGLVRSLENVLAGVAPPRAADAAMHAAFGLIDRGLPAGAALLPFLEHSLGMSARTLRRRFDDSFGYGPKTLDRILRFKRFQRLLAANRKASMAGLALEAGYADQPHLIRESRRLFAGTPAQLARAMGDISQR